MMCCVNMATPIHFINGKCYIKQFKEGKSHETCLTNHTRPISLHIMPLVINALGNGHTDTHTNVRTKEISRNQVCTAFSHACLVEKFALEFDICDCLCENPPC